MAAERYDTRPRVDRFNVAVYKYFELLEGPANADAKLQQLLQQQASQGLGQRSRVLRTHGHPPGYPIFELTSECRAMASAILHWDWLSNVGKELGSGPEVIPVTSWDEACRGVVGGAWEQFTVDAMGKLMESVASRSQEVFNELWNEVTYAIDAIIEDNWKLDAERQKQIPEQWREKVVSEIRIMVRLACQEQHWARFGLLSHPIIKPLYDWLSVGRLPCGVRRKEKGKVLKIF